MSWEDVAIDENGRVGGKEGQLEDFGDKKVIAVWRTRLWLASGWVYRGRRLSRVSGSLWGQRPDLGNAGEGLSTPSEAP